MTKRFSQACANNSQAILEQLTPRLTSSQSLLEVGSGTGQHAVCFSRQLPHIQWQCSDLPENHPSICAWLEDEGEDNCLSPVSLDVAKLPWSGKTYDAVFTANTLHIMSWAHVEHFFRNLPHVLNKQALVFVYGPFNYDGLFTSESNAQFDGYLKQQDSSMGIRDIEAIDTLTQLSNLVRVDDIAMPANNRLQVWCYQP